MSNAGPENSYTHTDGGLTEAQIIRGINLWLKDYTDHPEQYENEYASIRDFLTEWNAGVEPTYGQVGLALMRKLLDEQKK